MYFISFQAPFHSEPRGKRGRGRGGGGANEEEMRRGSQRLRLQQFLASEERALPFPPLSVTPSFVPRPSRPIYPLPRERQGTLNKGGHPNLGCCTGLLLKVFTRKRQLIAAYARQNLSLSDVKPFVVTFVVRLQKLCPTHPAFVLQTQLLKAKYSNLN